MTSKFFGHTRPKLQPAKMGHLTQGTVFNCVSIPRYEDCSAHGLVVTARCDIAQDKINILNFVPVVALSDWFERDCLSSLVNPEQKDLRSRITQTLSDADISPTILESVNIMEVERQFFTIEDGMPSKQKKLCQRFQKARNEYEHFNSVLDEGVSYKILQYFQEKKPKNLSKVIERLLAHDYPDFYLFERLLEDDPETAYIALLRDVMSLDREFIECIAGGLSPDGVTSLKDRLGSVHLSIPHGELCMPVAQIGSPTIEHLMQKFSSLFSRIGLEDPDERWKKAVLERFTR